MRINIAGLVSKVLSGSLVVAVGCSSTSATTSLEGFHPVCQGAALPLVAGFKPQQSAEFIELRSESAFINYVQETDAGADGGDGGAGNNEVLVWQARSIEHTGTACSAAGDGSTCSADYAALRVLPTGAQECVSSKFGYRSRLAGCVTEYIAFTRGAKVGASESVDDAKAFFGTIDTQEEALYLAQKQGYTLSCTDAPTTQVRQQGSSYLLIVQKRDGDCKDGITEVLLNVDSAGTTTVVSQTRVRDPQPCAIGRRPAGLCDLVVAHENSDAVGAFFAEAAKLEAASVHAFARLGEELRELGADATLLERVENARKEEVRHAKSTAAIARRFGHAPQRATLGPAQKRTMLEIALENATEGCVRETYGAIVAAYQARTAGDAEIARELAIIATDEASHAQLSWDIAAWFEDRLSADERATVKLAQARALTDLREDLALNPDTRLITLAGLPVREVAQKLLDAAAAELFAA